MDGIHVPTMRLYLLRALSRSFGWPKGDKRSARSGRVAKLAQDRRGYPHYPAPAVLGSFDMQRRMLSREDEAAAEKGDLEVRREDQDKINKFSRLHQREMLLEDDLKSRAKEKEDLEEISNELELADEDEKVPYKLGDAFIMLPLPEVQQLLSKSTHKIESSVSATEEKLSDIREEMNSLKVDLYARFGKSINLET
ncbi:MAG: hypothetical protein Q9176_003362 [Flavoplaca citrina]